MNANLNKSFVLLSEIETCNKLPVQMRPRWRIRDGVNESLNDLSDAFRIIDVLEDEGRTIRDPIRVHDEITHACNLLLRTRSCVHAVNFIIEDSSCTAPDNTPSYADIPSRNDIESKSAFNLNSDHYEDTNGDCQDAKIPRELIVGEPFPGSRHVVEESQHEKNSTKDIVEQ